MDSSTQSCKVVLRSLDTGQVVGLGRAAHPTGSEVDPQAWWDALMRASADAGGLDEVAAISVSAQQHGLVALDRGGEVIRPALLWNDTRSADDAARLVAEIGADTYARRLGVVPVASFTAAKLAWLARAEPSNAHRVAAVALPHDWLSWRLRGYGPAGSPNGPDLTALATDRSDASGTAYWSDSGYDTKLFAAAFGRPCVEAPASPSADDAVIVPRVLAPLAAAGPSNAPFAQGITVAAGCADNAGAALGLAIGPGDAVVSLGTSGTAFAVAERQSADPSGTVAGFADATGRFLPLVCTLNAARALDYTARLLGVDHDQLDRLALSAAPGADGITLVPYFDGERTPNLPEATGSLFGLTGANYTPENVARAAVEGMLCGLGAGIDAVRGQGIPLRRILIIGGAAASAAVQASAPEVFDLPVVIPTPGEYVAMGAARQGAACLAGKWPDWPIDVDADLGSHPDPTIATRYHQWASLIAQ